MKGNLVLFLTAIIIFSLLVGCATDNGDEKMYSVLVVQNGDDNTDEIITDAIDVSTGRFHEIKFLMSLEDAQKTYPEYEIEKAPAVLIFETGGAVLTMLEFKTYNLEEAVTKLKQLSNYE
ncbi:hypothetical protein IMZ08_18615 [Bacillus luteolus]|uniref:Small peptidoglycan-associated lipoprotein n=1 Tax=Litchfieldia luteola TaxID=682179 RepID=A0ABR9QNH3_9BACI|nr:hypothetical protein [Cytobacillus luteolus]MBE4910054.1 hypothetical protein [Cytobacillus luteolus]MBP1942384.1 hypothetical protein [Cytobacillus luteolus]